MSNIMITEEQGLFIRLSHLSLLSLRAQCEENCEGLINFAFSISQSTNHDRPKIDRSEIRILQHIQLLKSTQKLGRSCICFVTLALTFIPDRDIKVCFGSRRNNYSFIKE